MAPPQRGLTRLGSAVSTGSLDSPGASDVLGSSGPDPTEAQGFQAATPPCTPELSLQLLSATRGGVAVVAGAVEHPPQAWDSREEGREGEGRAREGKGEKERGGERGGK